MCPKYVKVPVAPRIGSLVRCFGYGGKVRVVLGFGRKQTLILGNAHLQLTGGAQRCTEYRCHGKRKNWYVVVATANFTPVQWQALRAYKATAIGYSLASYRVWLVAYEKAYNTNPTNGMSVEVMARRSNSEKALLRARPHDGVRKQAAKEAKQQYIRAVGY